tara:strand:- start:429 stop:821 length:393 start_codon:yes stop_codon:yes gene_type:complete
MNYSQDPEIEAASSLVIAALQEFYEQSDKSTKNPYEGMSYIASVVLKNLVTGKAILWKVKDQNRKFHWWCETKNDEVIDLTSKQYSLNNIGVPSSGIAATLKEQGRRTGFATQKKKEEQMMAIIEEIEKK